MRRFQGNSLERFCLALATFLKMSVRPCNLPKGMPRKAHSRTDRGSALGIPCAGGSGHAATYPARPVAVRGPIVARRLPASARISAGHHHRYRPAPASPLGTATTKLMYRDVARVPLFWSI